MSTPGERFSLPAFLVSTAGFVRREAVVEPLEVGAVDRAAVLEAEQALGVEPHPVRLLARGVVLVGMTERALALQVVLGRGRLGEGGYHGAVSVPGRYVAAVLARSAAAARANEGALTGFGSLRNGLVTAICRRLYHRSCISAIGTLVHWCEKTFSTFSGFTRGDSMQGGGSTAGSGRDRAGWGPVAGAEGAVR